MLVTAPSNHAADLLTSRLYAAWPNELPPLPHGSPGGATCREPSSVLRINSLSRNPKDVEFIEVQRLCQYGAARNFELPKTLEKLCSYRVIITTCVASSMLQSMGVPPGHFTQIMIDEAGEEADGRKKTHRRP